MKKQILLCSLVIGMLATVNIKSAYGQSSSASTVYVSGNFLGWNSLALVGVVCWFANGSTNKYLNHSPIPADRKAPAGFNLLMATICYKPSNKATKNAL